MNTGSKVHETNPPIYFTPRNIVIASASIVITMLVLTALGTLAVFLFSHFEVLEGLHAIIAYASVGGGGALAAFGVAVAGIIAFAIAPKRNPAPPKGEEVVESSRTSSESEDNGISIEDTEPPSHPLHATMPLNSWYPMEKYFEEAQKLIDNTSDFSAVAPQALMVLEHRYLQRKMLVCLIM